jgi:hypothetical protein
LSVKRDHWFALIAVDQRTGRRAAVSFQFGLLSAPSRPQAVHRSRRPIAGTSILSLKIDMS